MSQFMNKITKFAVKHHKPSESASRRLSRGVRDSIRTMRASTTNNNYSTSTFTLLICSCMLGAGLFLGSNVDAAQYSLTLSIDNPAPTVNVSPTATGAFAKSDAVTISASTTNATGYTLSVKAANGTNYDKLIGTNSNLSSISSSITEDEFKALNSTSYNNQWGYKPQKLNSETNNFFLKAPNTTGDTLEETEEANSTANTYTLELGARVDTTTSIGTYSNTYVVTLVGNAVPYTITYIDNTIASFPVDVNNAKTESTTVNISTNIPVRPGYTFLGWCSTTPTVNTNGTDTCSGTTYNPGDPITISQTGGSNNFNLYAMWGGNYTIDALMASGTVYMQDFNTMSADKKGKIIASMPIGQRYTLRDNRDNEDYYIAKLKDGNVWMLDNLRLGSNSSSIALTPSNTNIVNNWTLPQGITSGFNGTNIAHINAAYKNDTTVSYGQGSGKVGVYYNFCAASAGTYCYGWSDGVDVPNTNIDAPFDLCSAGWRMPTSGSSGEYLALLRQYNTTTIATNTASLQYNISVALSGDFDDATQSSLGTYVRFWSSTYFNAERMNSLDADPNSVNSSGNRLRSRGSSLRCILK